jgi:hypothetical protein
MLTRSLVRLVVSALALSVVAVAQNADGSFQVRYASNLNATAAATIYSTDGVPLGVFGATGYRLNRAAGPACTPNGSTALGGGVALGMKFTSLLSVNVTSVQVALVANATGVNPGTATFPFTQTTARIPPLGQRLTTLYLVRSPQSGALQP